MRELSQAQQRKTAPAITDRGGFELKREEGVCNTVFYRPGSDLLSRALRQSTIGAEAVNDRVRNGIGWGHLAITTRPVKNSDNTGRAVLAMSIE